MSALQEKLLSSGVLDISADKSNTYSITDSSKRHEFQLESLPFTSSVSSRDSVESMASVTTIASIEHADGMSWKAALFLMTVSLIGIGVLGVPVAMSYLGWGLGSFAILFFGAFCCYSGIVISTIVMHVTLTTGKRPRKYRTLGYNAFGRVGDQITFWCQMVSLAGVVVALQQVAASSLKSFVISTGGNMCVVTSNLIVSALMLPVMQFQTLQGVTVIALVGVVLIVVAVIIFLWEVVNVNHTPVDSASGEPASFGKAMAGMMTIAFAYEGQSIFPEIQSEMAHPQDMPKAVVGSGLIMFFVYLFVGVMGYAYLGSSAEFLELWADHYEATVAGTKIANACLFFHVLAGFTISANVVNQAVCESLSGPPEQLSPALGGSIIHHNRATWFGVTFATGLVAFLVSNLVPTIGLLVSLLGASCGSALSFLIPISVLLKIVPLSPRMRTIHICLLLISLILTCIGTYQTAKDMVDGIADGPPPFSC